MIIRGGKSVAASFVKSLGCSLIGRSHPVEPFSFTGARGISDGFVLAQIVAILLDCFVFYTTQLLYGSFLYLYLRRLSPFPAFSSRNNVGGPSREDRGTALMRCMHHLRAARESGLLSTVQVQGGKTEYLMWVSCLTIYIYIYCYCVIQLYTYISILLLRCLSIVLFVYCFIACLKHGSIAFFISIFYFCSLLRPLFFYDSGCRLSIIWLFTVQRYGGSVRYQTPGDALFG